MNGPMTTQDVLLAETSRAPIALMRKQTSYTHDLKQDYSKALRQMLEQAIAAAKSAERQIAKQQVEIKRLKRLSITDEHTTLLNKRGFSEALERTMARTHRYGEPAVLLLIDLDGFKAVNDTHGHLAGDLVLSVVAENLKNSVRKLDDVARLGGDEFAVILNNASEEFAERHARAIESRLNRILVPWKTSNIEVRASVGSHCFGTDPKVSAQTIYEQADKNMYLKKQLGHPGGYKKSNNIIVLNDDRSQTPLTE